MERMSLRRLRLLVLSILCIDFIPTIQCLSANSQPTTFCKRAVASRSCAVPPTFDSINLHVYLGRWYEIGSSANFKLTQESGSVCDQAKYNNSSGKLLIVNSSLKVIGSSGMTAVSAVTTATSGVCNGARDICYDLAPSNSISEALKHVFKAIDSLSSADEIDSSLLLQTSQKLLKSLELTETALGSLAGSVNQIQQSNSQVSQATASLKDSIMAIERYASEASKEKAVINALVRDIYKARSELMAVNKKLRKSEAIAKHELDQAASLLGDAAQMVAGSSSAIDKSLKDIKAGAAKLLGEGQPLENGFVSFVNGTITQNRTSPGKLVADVEGDKGPYWILDLVEDGSGGYIAALVYSCTELNPGRLERTIFILSREPQLDEIIVNRFLELAESYGIYHDCENPFLFSVQRGGNCGEPT